MNTWVFKVALGWNRRIWRTVELLDSQTLHDLHTIIQAAFGWNDDHLYAFFMTNKAWDRQDSYGAPHSDMPSASRVRIDKLGLRPSQKFLYIFDFGDELRHEITAVARGTFDAAAKYPRILQIRGKAPPQYGEPED